MARSFDWITFDCYGTLIDWESGVFEAFVQTARRTLPLTREEVIKAHGELEPIVQAERYRSYRDVLTITAERMAERLGASLPAGGGFLAASLPSWRPFADTNAALLRLSEAGVRLGILSNVDAELLAATRAKLSVPFDLVVTAEDVKSYKPAHGHFLAAKAKLERARWLHAAQSLFHDVAPCRELGITSAWVNRQNQIAPVEPAPDFEVPDLAALAARIDA